MYNNIIILGCPSQKFKSLNSRPKVAQNIIFASKGSDLEMKEFLNWTL